MSLPNTVKHIRSTLFGVDKVLALVPLRRYRKRMGRKPKGAKISGKAIRAAREALGLSQAELAMRVGTDQRQIHKIEHELTKGGDIKSAVVQFLRLLPNDDLRFLPHIGNGSATTSPPAQIDVGNFDLPVFAVREAAGGFMRIAKQPSAKLRRPNYLIESKGAYAIEMVGDSMRERYRPGETLFIDPSLKVRPGFEYLFYDKDRGRSHVRHLVKITETEWRVRQTTPPSEHILSRQEWPTAERIAGTHTPDKP